VLDYIDEERKKRESLAEAYRKCLKDLEGITYLANAERVKGNCHYFVIRIDGARFGKDRDYVYEKFKEYNVFTRKYFIPCVATMPVTGSYLRLPLLIYP